MSLNIYLKTLNVIIWGYGESTFRNGITVTKYPLWYFIHSSAVFVLPVVILGEERFFFFLSFFLWLYFMWNFPKRGSNRYPLQWKYRVLTLTTGEVPHDFVLEGFIQGLWFTNAKRKRKKCKRSIVHSSQEHGRKIKTWKCGHDTFIVVSIVTALFPIFCHYWASELANTS